MDMTDTQILTYAISPFFIVSAVKLAKDAWPELRGKWVLLFAFVLSMTVTVLERIATEPDKWPIGVLAGFVLTVVSMGGNSKMKELAHRVGKEPKDTPSRGNGKAKDAGKTPG